jgi:hypothetical protein
MPRLIWIAPSVFLFFAAPALATQMPGLRSEKAKAVTDSSAQQGAKEGAKETDAVPPGAAAKPVEPSSSAKAASNVGGYSYSDKSIGASKPPAAREQATGSRRRQHGRQERPSAASARANARTPAFEMVEANRSRLSLRLSQPVAVEAKKGSGFITYVLRGAHVGRFNDTHALVAAHFNTPLAEARLHNHGNDVELRLQLKSDVNPTFQVVPGAAAGEEAHLVIDFPAGEYPRPEISAPPRAGRVAAPPVADDPEPEGAIGVGPSP